MFTLFSLGKLLKDHRRRRLAQNLPQKELLKEELKLVGAALAVIVFVVGTLLLIIYLDLH